MSSTSPAAETWPAPQVSGRLQAPLVSSIRPEPTGDEVAAMTMAIELLWPLPVAPVDASRRRAGAWRFSGRWWTTPVPARRARPWY